ncbi:dienelactone hydrolase family protein [Actinokineospora sp. PR83]|uniref:dienelactone hydrolase family protein n=1 Tax=Actinokineospora sp. PR83 TaxID=2884908 RepID=UPI001F1E7777|nr:dienelactone hydrolase family protein [Actinokineospora sp. PR83]MCG8914813.1 dienelactone hydrolase family protein [Actinokineospora sp. PR83]
MAQTRTEEIRLADDRALRLTCAEPDGVVRGGLVVLPEARGVTDAVRGMVAGLAAEGWLVAVPHLHDGDDHELDHDTARDSLSALSGDSVLAAADGAFAWLTRHGVTTDRTGVIGFELGGAAALLVAARRDVGAAVTVAGGGILDPLSDGLPALVEVAGELRCPWLGLYREEGDDITAEQVEKLRDAAGTAPVATDVVRFAFHSTYEAWQRALNWFDAHLR